LSQSRLLFGCFMGTFAPHDRPTCHSTAILHPSAGLRYGDNRNAHTAGPIRSCPGPGDPHRLRTLEHNRVSIDVAVELCKHSVHRHRTCATPSRCSCAALRGLKFSLRDFAQNEFIQCKGGNRPAKSLVLLLHPLQLLELIHHHAAAACANDNTFAP